MRRAWRNWSDSSVESPIPFACGCNVLGQLRGAPYGVVGRRHNQRLSSSSEVALHDLSQLAVIQSMCCMRLRIH